MVKYTITEAHSGTSHKEIAKAKRKFREGVREGKFPPLEEVHIEFSDISYNIVATFRDKETYFEVGSVVIN